MVWQAHHESFSSHWAKGKFCRAPKFAFRLHVLCGVGSALLPFTSFFVAQAAGGRARRCLAYMYASACRARTQIAPAVAVTLPVMIQHIGRRDAEPRVDSLGGYFRGTSEIGSNRKVDPPPVNKTRAV